MLITRSELRLALTAGLGNGIAALSGLPNGMYVPLAVLATCTGTYGGSLGLGRQRILGSLLGMGLLLLGFDTLQAVPMPLSLALTLAALRLLGGLLRLEVGYKVGGRSWCWAGLRTPISSTSGFPPAWSGPPWV